MSHKQKLLIHFLFNKFPRSWSICMFTVQFNFNLSCIVHKRGNRRSNSILKELRKLMEPMRATAKNVCVINIPQNSLFIFFLSLEATLFKSFFSFFIHSY